MSINVFIIAMIVGSVNYLFRYLPLRLRTSYSRLAHRQGVVNILLDTIGIASICALLVVSSVPQIRDNLRCLLPTVSGFAVLGLTFWKTRSIILPTLLSALAYGIVWKISILP